MEFLEQVHVIARAAAERRRLTVHQPSQVRRQYCEHGAVWLIYGSQGRPVPNRIDPPTWAGILELVQTRCEGFNALLSRQLSTHLQGKLIWPRTWLRLSWLEQVFDASSLEEMKLHQA